MRAPLVQRSHALVAAESAGGLRHLRQLPLICKHYQWDSAAGGSLLRPASGSNKQSKRAKCTAKPYCQGLPVHQVVFVEHERDWHARVLLADKVGLQPLRCRGAGREGGFKVSLRGGCWALVAGCTSEGQPTLAAGNTDYLPSLTVTTPDGGDHPTTCLQDSHVIGGCWVDPLARQTAAAGQHHCGHFPAGGWGHVAKGRAVRWRRAGRHRVSGRWAGGGWASKGVHDCTSSIGNCQLTAWVARLATRFRCQPSSCREWLASRATSVPDPALAQTPYGQRRPVAAGGTDSREVELSGIHAICALRGVPPAQAAVIPARSQRGHGAQGEMGDGLIDRSHQGAASRCLACCEKPGALDRQERCS